LSITTVTSTRSTGASTRGSYAGLAPRQRRNRAIATPWKWVGISAGSDLTTAQARLRCAGVKRLGDATWQWDAFTGTFLLPRSVTITTPRRTTVTVPAHVSAVIHWVPNAAPML
jgi:hypothetical protein